MNDTVYNIENWDNASHGHNVEQIKRFTQNYLGYYQTCEGTLKVGNTVITVITVNTATCLHP